jgi:hypothetical protein
MQRTRFLRLIACGILVQAVAGCSSPPVTSEPAKSATSTPPIESGEPDVPRKPPAQLVFHKTEELVSDPALRKAVDALAGAKRVESSHIGEAGAPSKTFALFDSALKLATESDIVALLQHESPIVRGYFAQHVARTMPRHLDALTPLFEDATQVESISGCIGSNQPLANLVLDALCYSEVDGVGRALIAIATSGGLVAGDALACAAPKAPKEASAIAESNLKKQAAPKLIEASLRVLAVSPSASACTSVREDAASSNGDVASAAVSALALCADDASSAVLMSLTSSSANQIARMAKTSAVINPKTSSDKRRELGGDRDTISMVEARLRKIMPSKTGSGVVLPILDELLSLSPAMGGAIADLAESPEATAFMRATIAKYPPPDATGWTAHTSALGYLSRVKDAASLPEFQKALASDNFYELRFALNAVGDLKDGTSRAAVQKLTNHKQTSIAELARQVLAKLP